MSIANFASSSKVNNCYFVPEGTDFYSSLGNEDAYDETIDGYDDYPEPDGGRKKKWHLGEGIIQEHLKVFKNEILTNGISKIHNSKEIGRFKNQNIKDVTSAAKEMYSRLMKLHFNVEVENPVWGFKQEYLKSH